MEIISIVTLAISGLLLTFGGSTRLISPIKNYLKNSGVKIENEVNILSEARGVGSVMMFGGIIMLLGTFIPEMTFTSHVVAILILLGFAVGRTTSISVDGKPGKLLIQGLVSEIVLGGANAFCLVMVLV